MKTVAAALVTVLVVASYFPPILVFASTIPAFLWSPHQDGFSKNRMIREVDYRTLSLKDLAKSVMQEGGWSNLLCTGMKPQVSLDLVLLFVGKELQSLDLSGLKNKDPTLVNLLEASYTRSNFSLAFPYIATSEEGKTIESSLVSEFGESCGHNFAFRNVGVMDSCSVEGGNYEKLAGLPSIQDYLASSIDMRPSGKTNLVVLCHGGFHSSENAENPESEGHIFSKLISSLEQLGARYAVLYISEPLVPLKYTTHGLQLRILAEGGTVGNGSSDSTGCNGVCQIKSSLLEGIFVGIVLLIILISGLCCMMGIDTPARFEAPQDS